LPFYTQARVLLLIRLATTNNKILSKLAKIIIRSTYKIEIGDNIKIDKGIFLPHQMCIVLGNGIIIGENVTIGQFSTIGGNYRKTTQRQNLLQKMPIIGRRVIIGPGTVIGGPVIIGDDVIIGANSVITKDIPSNRLAYGLSKISDKEILVDITGSYGFKSN
jgi:serine O-acetyltransferase